MFEGFFRQETHVIVRIQFGIPCFSLISLIFPGVDIEFRYPNAAFLKTAVDICNYLKGHMI